MQKLSKIGLIIWRIILFELKTTITGQHLLTSTRHPSVPITKNVLELDSPLPPRFLFKIDSKRALEIMPALMEHVDGIFLSRTELGIDEHPHNLAILQKELITQCNSLSKTIIISSELMCA
jgi:pyruvate kinase